MRSIHEADSGAIDLPLMAWSRQSEITGPCGIDGRGRRGAGAAGAAGVVDSLSRLLQQVNIDEWLKQESASDDSMTRFSEMTTSSSMYTRGGSGCWGRRRTRRS